MPSDFQMIWACIILKMRFSNEENTHTVKRIRKYKSFKFIHYFSLQFLCFFCVVHFHFKFHNLKMGGMETSLFNWKTIFQTAKMIMCCNFSLLFSWIEFIEPKERGKKTELNLFLCCSFCCFGRWKVTKSSKHVYF